MPITISSIMYSEALQATSAIVIKALCDGGEPVAVSVVNAAGHLVCFAAMDHVTPACVKLSQSKAYSAVIGQKDTQHWASIPKNEKSVDFDMRNWTDPNFSGFTGGVIITINNQVIGGIGVSGRKGKMAETDTIMQDNELAVYGRLIFNEIQDSNIPNNYIENEL